MKKSDSLLLLGLGVGAVFLLSKRGAASGQVPPAPSTMLDVSVSAVPIVGAVPFTVNFALTVRGGKMPLTRVHWNFGDGDASNFQSPSHTYTSVGRFPVLVEVSDSDGRDGTAGLNITAFNPAPVVPMPTPTPPAGQIYATLSYEEIPATAWQPAPEYAEGKIALTTDAPAGVSVGGTSADDADITYYYIDGKLIGVRNQ